MIKSWITKPCYSCVVRSYQTAITLTNVVTFDIRVVLVIKHQERGWTDNHLIMKLEMNWYVLTHAAVSDACKVLHWLRPTYVTEGYAGEEAASWLTHARLVRELSVLREVNKHQDGLSHVLVLNIARKDNSTAHSVAFLTCQIVLSYNCEKSIGIR